MPDDFSNRTGKKLYHFIVSELLLLLNSLQVLEIEFIQLANEFVT